MSQLLRWAFNSLAAACVVLCVATCVLWVRSLTRFECIFWQGHAHRLGVEWSHGQMVFIGADDATLGPFIVTDRSLGWFFFGQKEATCAWADRGNPLGFGVESVVTDSVEWRFGNRTMQFVFVPVWFPLLLLGALPVYRGSLAIRRHRRRIGNLCRACGYDLRASHGRCPECGTTPVNWVERR